MKINCDRNSLYSAVQICAGAVPQRSPKPVLHNLKVKVSKTGTFLFGTDLEIGVRVQVDGIEVLQPGECLIPAAELSAILRELEDDRIELECSNDQIKLHGKDSEFRLLSDDIDEYPSFPEFPKNELFATDYKTLRKMIDRTSFAIATEPSRYAINGVLLAGKGGKLEMVGTDGKRLAYSFQKVDSLNLEKQLKVICPAKGLNFLQRIVKEGEENIKIAVTDSEILFQSSTALLASRMIEGHYPNYMDVIPKDLGKAVSLKRNEFMSCIRKASLTTNEESRAVKFEFSDGALTLSSRAPELGEAKVKMAVDYDGDDVSIGFDPKYLLAGLKSLDSDEVKFEFKDAESAGLVREGKEYIYVIMPISMV